MMERYICLHGHFYQPPRENPWLEAIELQESAQPYHDWNERITDECYATNAASRILDDEEKIVEIVNNYAEMSYNFGATLLAWLETHHPLVYEAILQADRQSIERFSGHGSALAQGYNHMIMPLANARDRRTQVIWGIRDFEKRFGRPPEGMWLPETAVDIDTLEALTEQGITFTILAPHQAERVRPLAELDADETTPPDSAQGTDRPADGWLDVSDASIDPKRAYLQKLPSGREISLFFYDGPISRGIAFEQLLDQGDQLAERLLGAFDDAGDGVQLVHIATDGETYGHHHRHGDMALAYALRRLERDETVHLTNYGEFLDKHPPTWQVDIKEETSWSCAHGIGRWARDCGCQTGGRAEWTQEWRGPLRHSLDWLRDEVSQLYDAAAGELFEDPWATRNDYIDVIHDRSSAHVDRFLAEQAHHKLGAEETSRALALLELQRHAMLMFTSCGWFFSELSGIETVQVIQYAGRVVQLAHDLFGQGQVDRDIRTGFLNRLEKSESNLAKHRNGRVIYEIFVEPSAVDLERVGAHYAISSLFEAHTSPGQIYSYLVEDRERKMYETGELRLVVGHSQVTSEITLESEEFMYAALHLGGHNVTGGIQPYTGGEEVASLIAEAAALFQRAETPALVRLLDRIFDGESFSLRSLFRNEQHRAMQTILGSAIEEAESAYQQVYRRRAPLLRFLADLQIAQPRSFQVAAEIVLNRQLEQAFQSDDPDPVRLRALLDEVATGNIDLREESLGFAINERLITLSSSLGEDPHNLDVLDTLETVALMARKMPFEVNFWEAQNIFYAISNTEYPDQQELAQTGDSEATEWVQIFEGLAESLGVAIGVN
jgi:alpha-amylase/alpha-mannosidase (GH57 family)